MRSTHQPAWFQRPANLDYEIAVSHAITILATSTDGSSQSLVAVIDIENELEPPGDTDGNNVVDVWDLNNVRNSFGESGPGVLGDTNGDNRVDIEDLNAVRNNFGAGQPEPTRAERSVPRGVSAIGRASTSNVGQDRSWQQATDALFHGYDQQLLEALVDLEAKPMSRRAQVLPWRGPATRVRQLKPAVAELFVPSLVSTSAS